MGKLHIGKTRGRSTNLEFKGGKKERVFRRRKQMEFEIRPLFGENVKGLMGEGRNLHVIPECLARNQVECEEQRKIDEISQVLLGRTALAFESELDY